MIRAWSHIRPTHSQCANYNPITGICTLHQIPVNPNAPACPNFTPKIQPSHPHIQLITQKLPKELEIQLLKTQLKILEWQLTQIKKAIEQI